MLSINPTSSARFSLDLGPQTADLKHIWNDKHTDPLLLNITLNGNVGGCPIFLYLGI